MRALEFLRNDAFDAKSFLRQSVEPLKREPVRSPRARQTRQDIFFATTKASATAGQNHRCHRPFARRARRRFSDFARRIDASVLQQPRPKPSDLQRLRAEPQAIPLLINCRVSIRLRKTSCLYPMRIRQQHFRYDAFEAANGDQFGLRLVTIHFRKHSEFLTASIRAA